MFRSIKSLLLIILINNYLFASSEYGCVQDIVGIDEDKLN